LPPPSAATEFPGTRAMPPESQVRLVRLLPAWLRKAKRQADGNRSSNQAFRSRLVAIDQSRFVGRTRVGFLPARVRRPGGLHLYAPGRSQARHAFPSRRTH
jgi:hypothetical protein